MADELSFYWCTFCTKSIPLTAHDYAQHLRDCGSGSLWDTNIARRHYCHHCDQQLLLSLEDFVFHFNTCLNSRPLRTLLMEMEEAEEREKEEAKAKAKEEEEAEEHEHV